MRPTTVRQESCYNSKQLLKRFAAKEKGEKTKKNNVTKTFHCHKKWMPGIWVEVYKFLSPGMSDPIQQNNWLSKMEISFFTKK